MLRTLLAVAAGTFAAAMCFQLGRSTAHESAWPQPLAALVGAARMRFSPANSSGSPVQPELLLAALAAANENGALMLAVRDPCRENSSQQTVADRRSNHWH